MVTGSRSVLMFLSAGLLGRSKRVLCLRGQAISKTRGSHELAGGRLSEQPARYLDNSAEKFRAVAQEGEGHQQPWRGAGRRRRQQTTETQGPTMMPVPTVSYDDDNGDDQSSAGLTADDSSGFSEIEPTSVLSTFASTAPTLSASTAATDYQPTLTPTIAPLTPEPTTMAPLLSSSSSSPEPVNESMSTTSGSTSGPSLALTPSPTENEGNYKDDDEEEDSNTSTENPVPTPAPVIDSGVSMLSGLLAAPTEALESKTTLNDVLRDHLDLEDQDRLIIDTLSRRRRLGEFEHIIVGDSYFAEPLADRDVGQLGFGSSGRLRQKREREDMPPYALQHSDDLGWHSPPNGGNIGYEEYGRGRFDGHGHHRALAEETTMTRVFEVAFINDPGEWTAYQRGVKATVLLLNEQEVIAVALNTTEESITFSDVVYVSPSDAEIYTEEAISTFIEDDGSPTVTAVGLAVALVLLAVLATSCLGVAFGKCWLVGERGRRARRKEKQKPHELSATQRLAQHLTAPSLSSSSKRFGSGGGGGGGSSSSASAKKLAGRSCGESLPRGKRSTSGSGGGAVAAAAAAVAAAAAHRKETQSGQDPFLYSQDSALLGSGWNVERADISAGSGMKESHRTEDLVEHVYGDSYQTESLVDGIDGAFSEYEGQSEYDPVVLGGTATMIEGMLSDADSSRFYNDDERLSEWGTEDIGSQRDNVLLAGYPVRQGSSRFSAGPRSQGSFATPSVAASGRSALSSVIPPSSRTNFPPASGGAASPPLQRSEERGFRAGGGVLRGDQSKERVAPETTPTVAKTAMAVSPESTPAVAGAEQGKIEEMHDDGSYSKIENRVRCDYSSGGGDEVLNDGDAGLRYEEPEAAPLERVREENGEEERMRGDLQVDCGAAAIVKITGAVAVAANGGVAAVGPEEAKELEEEEEEKEQMEGKAEGDVDITPALIPAFAAKAPPADSASTERESCVSKGGVDPESSADADTEIPEEHISDLVVHEKRPSLDSAAGSVTFSSVVALARRGAGSGGAREREIIFGEDVPQAQGGGNGDSGIDIGIIGIGDAAYEDDDACSRYAGSSVANESFRQEGRSSRSSRPTRVMGSLTGGPTGRNSQSVGGMSMPFTESSHDSDRESLMSRAESFAFTDIGRNTQEGTGSQGRGHGLSGISPTSTMMRSSGLSELGTERDSFGSDGYTNGSDSPGGQSGWERAWMRQREDARLFGRR